MKDKKVVFMGTPDFAVNPLKLLIDKCNVVLVVTKPDALVGRKKILTPSPVKQAALNNNTNSFKNVYKINKVFYSSGLKCDRVDIYCSGAAPIQWALLNGEEYTGVTLMYMDEFMDTGDIIAKKEYKIDIEDNIGTLHDRLSLIGTKLLEENLEYLFSEKVVRIKQNDKEATYAKMIDRDMEEINFNDTCLNIYNKVRAFSPWPLSKTTINGEEVKIIKCHYEICDSIINKLYIDKNNLGIGCTDGIIYLDIIKPVGKGEMPIKNYLNGKNFNK